MKNIYKTEEQIEKARLACKKYYEEHKEELNKKRVKYQVKRYKYDSEFRRKRCLYAREYARKKKQ